MIDALKKQKCHPFILESSEEKGKRRKTKIMMMMMMGNPCHNVD